MAVEDINAGRRAELEAQLAIVEPQIRGLDDMTHVSISGDLRHEITEELDRLRRRRDLIVAELHAMDACNTAHDALLNDGYPTLVPASLPDALYDELQVQLADLKAGGGIFQPEASAMTIDLGKPVPKPAAPSVKGPPS